MQQDEARVECLLQDVLEVSMNGAGARAHVVKGTLRRLQGRLAKSRLALEMAIELAPHHAMAASQLGMTLLYSGRPDEALQWFERGVQVAPQDAQMPLLLNNLGTGRLLAGEVDKGIDLLLAATAGIPEHSSPPLMLAAAFGLKSELDSRQRRFAPGGASLSRLWQPVTAAQVDGPAGSRSHASLPA